MDEGKNPKTSWWQTVPGVLTAIAGVMTAAAGLLVTLHQVGWIGNKDRADKPAATSRAGTDATSADAGASPSSPGPSSSASSSTSPSTSTSAATSSPPPADKTTPPRGGASGTPPPYTIAFPAGMEATLRGGRSDGVYKILGAGIENRNNGTLTLRLAVRVTNTSPTYDLNFWSATFRMLVDGVPRAPTNDLNELVDARSSKEGQVVFDVPETAGKLVLALSMGDDTANIPIVIGQQR